MKEFDYNKLNKILHSRIRLAIVSILIRQEEADFITLRKSTNATDGNLNTHIKRLETENYISVTKKFINRKPVTLYKLTEPGKNAFNEYITQLEKFIKR